MSAELQRGARRSGIFVTSVALGAAMFVAGCQSHVWNCGGNGMAERLPLVTLESVTATKESPAWGYPFFQFPPPNFPPEMRWAGIAGQVVVRVAVGADGVVRTASIVKSTQPEFEASALRATEQWRFVEFPDLGVRERRGLVVDCEIRFEFDES